MALFAGTTGVDNFIGLATVGDTFQFAAATLAATDTVRGGGGAFDDTLQFTAAGSYTAAVFTGVSGIESLRLAAGTNVVSLSAGLVGTADAPFRIFGGTGNDTVSVVAIVDPTLGVAFTTGAGNNRFTGGAGNDLVQGGAGNDTVNGGGGVDTMSYLGAVSAVTVSLATTAGQATGGAGTDTLVNVENLTGSAFADSLTGSTTANVLDGGAGNDTLSGGSGVDTLLGGAGEDRLTGGLGADSLLGGDGSDTYDVDDAGDKVVETSATAATGGTDLVNATVSYTLGANVENLRLTGTGNIAATGNTLANTIHAGAGDNLINGAGGTDTLSYAFATAGVTLSLALGTAQATGGSGSDTVSNLENLVGSALDDRLTGNAGGNVLDGGLGNDTLDGAGGNDTLRSSVAALGAADVIGGGLGTDRLELATAGSVAAAVLAGLGSVEQIALAPTGATTLTLDAAAVTQAGGVLTVLGSAASGDVDASAVGAGGSVVYIAGAGAESDQFTGGAGDDVYVIAGPAFGDLGLGDDVLRLAGPGASGDSVAGGGGTDVIEITAAGSYELGGFIDFEEVSLRVGATVLMSSFAPGQLLEGSTASDNVTVGAAGQTVLADAGDDTVTVGSAFISGAVLSGGTQTVRDTLILQGAGTYDLLSDALVTGFERIELASDGAGSVIVLGNTATEVVLRASAVVTLGLNPGQSVVGSRGADVVEVGAAGQVVATGAGADLLFVSTSALAGGAQLAGGTGSDRVVLTGGGTIDLSLATAVGFETVELQDATTLTTSLAAGVAVQGSAGADSITLRGAAGSASGGDGDDTLRTLVAGNTLSGGNGADTFVIASGDQAVWTGAANTLAGGGTFVLDTVQIGTGANAPLAIDFTQHIATGIDRALITPGPAGATVTLTIGDALVSSADGNNGGVPGDFHIDATATVLQNVNVNAGSLTGNNLIRFNGGSLVVFAGADSVTGGAGNDSMSSSAGNDTLIGNGGNDLLDAGDGLDSLVGGAGNDNLRGGNGSDTITGGEGADDITGGAGGDTLFVGTEALVAQDILRFTSILDGSADINTTVAEATADRVVGFAPAASDVVALSRSGLGLGTGGVVSVLANGAWNIGTGAVFIFESDSVNNDVLSGDNFGDLAQLAFAVNTDNANGTGSSTGRTVALIVSNNEASAVRRTGVYVWTDTDGDNVVESTDVVQLLAVFDGVTANQFNSSDVLIG